MKNRTKERNKKKSEIQILNGKRMFQLCGHRRFQTGFSIKRVVSNKGCFQKKGFANQSCIKTKSTKRVVSKKGCLQKGLSPHRPLLLGCDLASLQLPELVG